MRILQPASHGVEPRVELHQPLFGHGIGERFARPQLQHNDDDNAERDDPGGAEGEDQGRVRGQVQAGGQTGKQFEHVALLP